MIFEGDRLAEEVRVRVRRCESPRCDGDSPEVFRGRSVFDHVATRHHRDPGRRSEQAVGCVPAEVSTRGRGFRLHVLNTGSEAVQRPLVHRAVAHDGVCNARSDRHRGLLHRCASGATSVVDSAEEGQVAATQEAVHLDGRIVVHREGHHSVDVGVLESRIFEGGTDAFESELQFAAAGILRELGCADPYDRSAIAQVAFVPHPASRSGGSEPGASRITRSPRISSC
jgi:hypothetical protein